MNIHLRNVTPRSEYSVDMQFMSVATPGVHQLTSVTQCVNYESHNLTYHPLHNINDSRVGVHEYS